MSRRDFLRFKMSPSKVDNLIGCRGFDSNPFVETPATISGNKGHKALETNDLSGLSGDELKNVKKAMEELQPFFNNVKEVFKEIKLPIDFGPTKVNGIIDLVGIKDDQAFVIDYKFGYYLKEAEANGQLECYFIAVMDRFPQVNKFQGSILQPTLDYFGHYELTRDDLPRIRAKMAKLYSECAVADPVLTAGDQCNHCKYSKDCPALIGEVITVAGNLEGPQLPKTFDPENLTGEQREQFMDAEPFFKAFFASNKKECLEMAQNGVEFDHYHIKSRRKPTLIKDPNCIYSALEADPDVDLSYEEFLSTTNVSLKQLENIVRSKAGKGFGAAKVAALHESLDHCLINDAGKTEFLARRKGSKDHHEGGNY